MKHKQELKPSVKISVPKEENNNVNENNVMMTTSEKIAAANEILNGANRAPIRKIKKDRGLIERTESSKTILTEDNKELLND